MHRRPFALAAAFVLVAGILSVPIVHAAGRPACLVSNERTGFGARSLQVGIDAAAPDDTLVVKGSCVGSSTITESLTLKGVSNRAFGPAILDGGDAGQVLHIRVNGTVTIIGLTITNGTAFAGGGIEIEPTGTVTLIESTVTGNTATEGGGIFNFGSALTLVDSVVSANSASSGGGIAATRASVTLDGTSSVDHNTATSSGGGIVNVTSEAVTLNNRSSVHDNIAGEGGGIYNGDASTTLNDAGSIYDNTAVSGGGVYNFKGWVALSGTSSIRSNTASGNGGGVFNILFSSLMLADDSSIHDNAAGNHGGGVYCGAVALADAGTIVFNTPDDWYAASPTTDCID